MMTPNQIYIVDADGGNLHALVTGEFAATNLYNPSWSPIGNAIAFGYDAAVGRELAYTTARDIPTDDVVRLPSGGRTWDEPDWSPDGSRLVFVDFTSKTELRNQLWSIAITGGQPTRLSPDLAGLNDRNPAWSPFITRRLLVGSGGLLGTRAAGFIIGQQGHAVTSALVFDSTMPTSARVTTTTGINAGLTSYLFSITTPEKLTALTYTNALYATPINVITATTPASNGALVSYHAQTGTVATVLLYTSTRAAGTPAVSQSGTALVVHGAFLGIFDATGTNHAPHGTSEVRLDAITGALVTMR